jgi:hypothetical protein
MPRLERPRVAQIIDGDKIIAEEFAGMQKAAFDVLASDFQKKVEALIARRRDQTHSGLRHADLLR